MILAITGGIGSGKSVVSRILATMGIPVYDTDLEARRIMSSPEVSEQLQSEFGDAAFNRKELASIVFNNSEKLLKLNAIVHPAVRLDFKRWCHSLQVPIIAFETALLSESGMDHDCDAVILVDAPEEVRIERVIKRNGIGREDVVKRIISQNYNPQFTCPVYRINNDNNSAVLLQLMALPFF